MRTTATLLAAATCTGLCAQNTIDRYLSDPLTYTNIVTSADQVNDPRDLDFKPNTNELWVMLRGGSNGGAMVIVSNAGLPSETDQYRKDSHSGHFMVQASAMAFSDNGEWAAVSEIQNTASPTSTFMGPALWEGDLNRFAEVFQNNWVSGQPLGSHIDMLHQSPFSMGIAADSAKVYWVFDGHNDNICRYDFVQDHGPGYDYHGAGKIWRYIDVTVTRVPNIPSHMVMDRENGWLYFVDGGPKQIKRLNVNSGAVTGNLSVPSTASEPLAGYYKVEGAVVETIDTWTTQPSGIEYSNGRLLVSDHTNGDIKIYDVTGTPTVLGTIPTGQTSIMGLKVGPDGRIWFVNNTGDKVVRIDPLPLANDAAITAIVTPKTETFTTEFFSIDNTYCTPGITPVVTLRNAGSNDLTSADIGWSVDGGAVTSYAWTGLVAPGGTVDVTLPTGAITSAAHELIVTVSNPNGVADSNDGNNTMAGSFRAIDPVQTVPFQEGFTASTFPPAGWSYVHFNPNNGMAHNPTVGGFDASNGCIKMDNYSGDMDITGQLDHLIMPRVDLSTATTGTTIDFAVAYRQYNSSTNDRLRVKVSSDCGDNWSTLYDKAGVDLATAAPGTSNWNTPAATEWRTEYVDLATVIGEPDVLIMFESESNFGNNLFLDDVRIANTVGVAEHGNAYGIRAYPNPATDRFTLAFATAPETVLLAELVDVTGAVARSASRGVSDGATWDLDLTGLANGCYAVRLSDDRSVVYRTTVVVR